jgi:hypothetical protein
MSPSSVTIPCPTSTSWRASTGTRAPSLMAARIEAQTREVAARSGGRLKTVPRESLVRYPEIFEREEPYLMVAEERP